MNIDGIVNVPRRYWGRVLTVIAWSCWLLPAGQTSCPATTVGLQWDSVSESGVAGYKVYYQPDSASQPFAGYGAIQGDAPVDALNQTVATIGGLDPAHAYYFAVTAYNTAGVESLYSNVVYVPELLAPTVSVTSPANNATVSGAVSVSAAASDNVGVTKVEFYRNGVLQATEMSAPYVLSWDTTSVPAGSYTLSAKAYDAAGNIGNSGAVSVTVVNDTTPPTVAVLSPVSNAIVSGKVSITASASDNVGVEKVEFYEDGALITATNVAPYSCNWDTSGVGSGSHVLTARAYDAANNVGQSSPVQVTVNYGGSDVAAPTVVITSPSAGTKVGSRVTISASATDNLAVTKMELYVDGELKATTNNSVLKWTWKTTSYARGSHVIKVVAYDAAQNAGFQSITVRK